MELVTVSQFHNWWTPDLGAGLVCYVVGCGVGDDTCAVRALPWRHECLVSTAQVSAGICCFCFLSGSSVWSRNLAVYEYVSLAEITQELSYPLMHGLSSLEIVVTRAAALRCPRVLLAGRLFNHG